MAVAKEHLYFVEIAKRRGLVGDAAVRVALQRAEAQGKAPREVLDLEPADLAAVEADLAALAFVCARCSKKDHRTPGSPDAPSTCEDCQGFVSSAPAAAAPPAAAPAPGTARPDAPAWQTRKHTEAGRKLASERLAAAAPPSVVGPNDATFAEGPRPVPAAPIPAAPAAGAPPSGEAIATGQVIGGCRIVKKLGQGGMGRVYRAHHLGFDRDVALKVLDEKLVARAGFIEQFTAEARVLFGLDHPNVVRVFNVDKTESGTHFLVMELLEGQSLQDLWEKGGRKLPIDEAVRLATEAAKGLHHAHQKKLLHRDVKPANLMLNAEGRVKVVDFGLAVPTENELFVATAIAGTPHYMAPEQADGLKLDARCDQYALGVTLFQLLCGRVPFDRKKLTEILFAHMTEAPPRPRELRPDVPEWLERVVLRMLEKAPGSRFPSLGEAITALERGESAAAEPPPVPGAVTKRIRLEEIVALEKGVAPKPIPLPTWRPAAAVVVASLVAASVFVAIPAHEAFARSNDVGRDEVPVVVRDLEKDVAVRTADGTGEVLAAAIGRVSEAAQDLGSRPGAGRLDALKGELEKRLAAAAARAKAELAKKTEALLARKRFGAAVEGLATTAELEALGLAAWAAEERARVAAALLAAQGEVYVPRGYFLSGETGKTKSLLVEGFYLDATEVPNEAWASAREAAKLATPAAWPGGALDPALARRPVTGISFAEAEAFARARGKRLPTSLEWEKAARGVADERAYPWGDHFDPTKANVALASAALEDVGTRAGDVGPSGAHDLAGNALEWVVGEKGPLAAGGGWLSHPASARAWSRLAIDPATRHPGVGFRCARDLEK